jgi:microcystin degradation protein MlrC
MERWWPKVFLTPRPRSRAACDLAGPDVPIAVTLDLHANIGQAMVDRVDVITAYDTYPHVDAAARAGSGRSARPHDPA